MEKVLDGVRPFLSVVGGSIRIESLRGINSIQVSFGRLTGGVGFEPEQRGRVVPASSTVIDGSPSRMNRRL